MTPQLFSRTGLLALATGALITLSAKPSHAEQFVLFDVTFDFTWEDAINAKPSQSHYYVKENNGLSSQRPDDWLSPIDYRNGKVHIHLEVLEKPEGGQENGWALCYVGNAGSYGCPYTDYYTATGTYEKEVDMTNFYNDDTIDWSKGIAEVDLVYTIDGSGHGHVHFYPELKDKTTPTKVRIALVQVAKGSTYDPSMLAGGEPGGGGGTGAGGAAGASTGGTGTAGSTSGSGGMGGVVIEPMQGGMGGTPGQPAASGSAGSAVAPSTAGTASGPAPAGLQSSNDATGCSLSAAPRRKGWWLALAALAGWGARRRRARA